MGNHVWVGFSLVLVAGSSFPPMAWAQRIDPGASEGARPLPPAYYERIRERPDFFQIKDGWIRRTDPTPEGAPPLSGTLPVVLVLGLFADSPEPPVTHEDLQAALFDGPSEYGTVSGYFHEVSGGRLAMTAQALPWVRTSITLAQAVGDSYGLGDDAGTGAFLFEMLVAVDGGFDFGLFDNDGLDGVPNSGDDDGFVDAVAFQFLEVSASCGGPGIWPHRSRLEFWNEDEPFVTDDARANGGSIRVNDYTIQSAMDCGGAKIQTATTMAHELGHVLGLPDLYDRSQGLLPEERRWVVGCWSLMAAGAWGCGTSNREAWVRPTHMGAWEKSRLGWLSGVEVVGRVLDQEFVLEPVQSSEQALRIPLETGFPSYPGGVSAHRVSDTGRLRPGSAGVRGPGVPRRSEAQDQPTLRQLPTAVHGRASGGRRKQQPSVELPARRQPGGGRRCLGGSRTGSPHEQLLSLHPPFLRVILTGDHLRYLDRERSGPHQALFGRGSQAEAGSAVLGNLWVGPFSGGDRIPGSPRQPEWAV